jgi:hypothetical protein
VVELTSMQLEKEIDENGTRTGVKELFGGEINELKFSGLISDESCEMLGTKNNNFVGLYSNCPSLGDEASESLLQVGMIKYPSLLIRVALYMA